MGLVIKKESGGESIPIFQKVIELIQGGFTLVKTGLSGTVKKGTPVYCNEANRQCTPFKSAVMQAAAAIDATKYRVLKGSLVIVGDVVTTGVGAAGRAISSIDTTTSTAYDELTLTATLGVALVAGDVIFKSGGAAGADTGSLHVTPNALLYEDVEVGDNEPVSALIRGTVYKRRIPNGVIAEVQAALPHIIFSNSF